jgi:hypothetical protein
MFFRSVVLLSALCFGSGAVVAQGASHDVADQALISVFQRDSGRYVCGKENGSLQVVREWLNPFIQGIDVSDATSYPALAQAVYTAFPCPFSPIRPELRPAVRADLVGYLAGAKLIHALALPAQVGSEKRDARHAVHPL